MEFIQQNILWVGLALVSGGMLVYSLTSGGSAGGISVPEATLLLNREDAMILDVRETQEWSAGHIANARHIASAQLEKRISEIEKFKETPVIVCCAGGSRSGAACNVLRKAGFLRVYNLAGGISAWTGAGLPLTAR